jgi:hypothetical protein
MRRAKLCAPRPEQFEVSEVWAFRSAEETIVAKSKG